MVLDLIDYSYIHFFNYFKFNQLKLLNQSMASDHIDLALI